MKITPLEIRQKTFEKNFRGYDTDEVTSFLATLAQEWEKLMDEKKDIQFKLDHSEKEAAKLKEVESSLYRTLKTAEDTGASIIEQATTAADQLLQEAQMDAEMLQNDAKQKSQNMIESAEQKAKQIIGDLKIDLQELVTNYEDLLNQRKQLLDHLKELANKTLDTIDGAEDKIKNIDLGAHISIIGKLENEQSVDNAVEKKFQQVQDEILAKKSGIEENKEIPDINISQDNGGQEQSFHKPIMDNEMVTNDHDEEEGKNEIDEDQSKLSQPKPTYVENKAEQSIQKPKSNQSGSFFDQFD